MMKKGMKTGRVVLGLGCLLAAGLAGAEVTWRTESVTLPTYPYGDPDPVATAQPELYPYFRYDGQSAESRPQAWNAVKLSNGRIEVTMIPAIGGKVWGAKDLSTGRDFIYANDAVKFRDIAMRGPWCSGGIEFNFGITGHAPWTVSPVDWTVRRNADGSASYFFGGYELVTRTFWQVEVLLRDGEDFFTTKMTWHNSSGQPCTRYQWSTSAVTARGNPEMVYPGANQIDHDGTPYPWPCDDQGVNRALYANDNDLEAVSWHVINGDNRFFGTWWNDWKFGMWHRNAAEDKFGRKIFMWSQARSGGIWEDLLTDKAGQYIELQSGRGMQQQVGDCAKTPFKFQTLYPGATDAFEEQWGVAHDARVYEEAKAFPCGEIDRPIAFPKDYVANGVYALYRDGEQKMRYGLDVTGAADLLRRALAKDPCFVPALGELAAFELRRGNAAQAERLAAKALAVDTYDGLANFVSGEIALDANRLERARERFGVAALDANYRAAALVRLGMVAIRLGDYARAAGLAEKALACSAYDPEAHQLAAVAARLAGKKSEAKAAVERGLVRTPIHYGLSYEYLRLGGASKMTRGELPGPTLVETGLWYAKAGLDADAKRIWSGAPKSPVAKILSGDLAGAAALPTDLVFPHGRETIAALEKAVKADASWKFKYYLAIALAPMGETRRADKLLEACGDEPDAATFYLTRAARRKGAKAIADLTRAAALGDSWRVGCALAKAYLRWGKPAEAVAAANAYRAKYPGLQQLDAAAVTALIEAKRHGEALDILAKIRVLPSEFNKAVPRQWNLCHRELAVAAFKAGDRETAKAHVDAALSFPENLGDGRPVDPESALKDWPADVKALRSTPVRPYEMTLAARDRDEFPPVAKLEGADGWRVVAKGGTARIETTVERTAFGRGACRFLYDAKESNAVFRIESERPIAVPADADTVTLWVYGNNYNGRADYAAGRHIPELKLSVEFALGAETARVSLWKLRHPEWFMPMGVMDEKTKALVKRGAKLVAIVLEGGPCEQEEQLDFNSLCVFRDPKRPLSFAERPKLPFPTTELGIVPACADETVEFRYPAKPTESWDDLAFRVAGGEWIPLAVGGGIYPAAARTDAKVVFSRHGDSVIADIEVKGGVAEEVRFGAAKLPAAFERVPIPYYTFCEYGDDEKENRPWLLSTEVAGAPLFILASMDWNRSAASVPMRAYPSPDPKLALSSGGAEYKTRTDGTRHDVRERFVWSVSRDPAKVLPEIPNPPSPYKALVGSSARCVLPAFTCGSHEKDFERVAGWKRRGMERLILTDHEVLWRDGNESFTFRTMAAPGKGGDKAQAKYTRRLIDGLGIVYGPYNNYTDFAPVNRWWSIDNVTRAPDGNPVQAWYRCYAPKPTWSREMNALIAPRIQAKFGFNCAYCDVHTCISPWDRTDYDARVPGAGTYGETMRAYADILLTQRDVWKGPVCSEGGCQYLYSGLHDNSYAQDAQYGLSMRPWLVDFALLKMHPLNIDCGAGLMGQFYCWWRTMDDTDPKASAEWRQSRWLAATLAFGHSALLDGQSYLRSYFAVQAIASKYTVAKAAEIRYGAADGKLLDTARALATGAYRRSQVRVAYDDGTVVAANGSRTDDFTVEVGLKTVTLPPNGWCAVSGDGTVETFSGNLRGQRVEYADAHGYTYVNGFGKAVSTPYGGTDGLMVRRVCDGGEEVVVENAKFVELPYVATDAELLGETRETLGPATFVAKDGVTRVEIPTNAVSVRLAIPTAKAEFFNDVKIPMRDGVNLAGDLYLPKNRKGRVGCWLSFSPYRASASDRPNGVGRAEEWGVASMDVDCRGLCHSEGKFDAWDPQLVEDADDLLKWIAAQPWCNGRVVMTGGSYPGYTQMCSMLSGNPALVACAPSVITFDPYTINFQNGVLVRQFFRGWHSGLAGEEMWEAMATHPARDDAYWKARTSLRNLKASKGRAFYQAGWFDMLGISTFESFREMPEGSVLRIGPWSHGVDTFDDPEINYRDRGGMVTEDAEIEFLLSALRGRESVSKKWPGKILMYTMGRNEWRYENEWPLARTKYVDYDFTHGETRSFRHDPKNPVPMRGGRIIHAGGQYDQREIEKRADVLSYTGETLAADLEVTGNVSAKLRVSSTAASSDVTVKLVDVYPDGRAMNVLEGISRESFKPGEEREVAFFMDITSYVFLKGHKIRIDVAGSCAPHFDVNPNAATVTVHAGSKVVLPTIPPSVSAAPVREEVELSDWRFSRDGENWSDVTVPHDWAIAGPFDKKIDMQVTAIVENGEKTAREITGRTGSLPWIGQGEYRRTIEIPAGTAFASLVFDGAMSEPEVFCDGEKVGEWKNGYNAFEVALPATAGRHEIAVKLTNRPESSRWYPGAGLFRPVRLVLGGETGVKTWGNAIWTPDLETVRVKTECRGQPGRIVYRILDGAREIAASEEGTLKGSFVPWSPENPKLYTLVTEVYDAKGKFADRRTDRFGVRTLEYGKKGFLLNGQARKFKGVCMHHDLGPLGSAFDKDAFRRQMTLLREMGCDSLRTSHNMPAEGQLEVCDELGIMVMAESFDSWGLPKVKNGYNLFFRDWWRRDLENLVKKCRNHPSVVMWSIGNEVYDQREKYAPDTIRAMQELIHSFDPDPGRKVTQGLSWMPEAILSGANAAMEIPAVTYRLPFYEAMHTNSAAGFVLGAETASTVSSRGEYFFPPNPCDTNVHANYQCSSYDVGWAPWSNLPDDDWAMQEDKPWTIGEFVWAGFDYLGEPWPYDEVWPSRSSYFGIFDLAGLPKDRYWFYRSHWNEKSHTLHLLPHWTFPDRVGKVTPVYCYTDFDEAELFVNGKSQGRRKKYRASRLDRFRLRWNDVVYEPGELKVVAYDADGKVALTETVRTAGAPAKVELAKRRFGKLLFVTASIVDKDGTLVPSASDTLTFTCGKDLKFKGICNGDATSVESFVEPHMKAFHGQLVAVFEGAGDEVGVKCAGL